MINKRTKKFNWSNVQTSVVAALCPLFILLAALSSAVIIAYLIVQTVGEVMPFRAMIGRLAELFLVLSIFPAMAYLKINRMQLGFVNGTAFFKQLIQGFALGFVSLMPVFVVLYVLKINVIDETQTWTLAHLAKNASTGLLVALIISMVEEPLFRGIMLTALRRKLPLIAAIVISSAYYAALHFLDTKVKIPLDQITLLSGFKLVGLAFVNIFNAKVLSAFFALLMVGIFLGVLRSQIKTSLGLCIGCHTCWVWLIKMSKSLFNTDYNSRYSYLVSSYDGVIGPLVTAWLLFAVVAYFLYKRFNTK